jgi:hypothetical protein
MASPTTTIKCFRSKVSQGGGGLLVADQHFAVQQFHCLTESRPATKQ